MQVFGRWLVDEASIFPHPRGQPEAMVSLGVLSELVPSESDVTAQTHQTMTVTTRS
jgi:hypothetical protein